MIVPITKKIEWIFSLFDELWTELFESEDETMF